VGVSLMGHNYLPVRAGVVATAAVIVASPANRRLFGGPRRYPRLSPLPAASERSHR